MVVAVLFKRKRLSRPGPWAVEATSAPESLAEGTSRDAANHSPSLAMDEAIA